MPTDNVSKVNSLVDTGLYEVKDAVKKLSYFVSKKHEKDAKCGDPGSCVFARAIEEALPDILAVEVSNTITKIVVPGFCYRYRTPPRLRTALREFDLTGQWSLPPGVYHLLPPKGRHALAINMTERARKKVSEDTKRRKEERKQLGISSDGSGKRVFKQRAVPSRRIAMTRGERLVELNEVFDGE